MGSGRSGLYSGTYGSRAVPGSTDFMDPEDNFSRFIRHRKDIDVDGFYDIVAHGSPTSITIQRNGKELEINHRIAARLFKTNKSYNGQGIRLLSCNTGKLDSGFAQNLANKLNVPVKAPTDILWATPSGHYYVAAGKALNGRTFSDRTKKGAFRTFYPQGRRRKK